MPPPSTHNKKVSQKTWIMYYNVKWNRLSLISLIVDLLRDEKKVGEGVKGDIEVSLHKIQKIIKEKS